MVNALDAKGRTALFCAVHNAHLKCVELLLAAGGDSSISDGKCFPLYIAAQKGELAIARALIKANANIDAITDAPNAGTAVFAAAASGHRAMVKLLLDAGCDMSITSAGGQHPLTAASQRGYKEVITLLLDAGADVSATVCDGNTALGSAALKGLCDVVKKLLEGGADVNQTSPHKTDPTRQ